MRIWIAVFVAVVLAGACSDPATELTPEDTATVRAEVFTAVCLEMHCPGIPVLAPDSLPDDVREAIRTGFWAEVEYVPEASLEARTGADGQFSDRAIFISPGVPYRPAERPDGEIVAVDVEVLQGYGDFTRRTYLFERDGDGWAGVPPSSIGLFVTTSVS